MIITKITNPPIIEEGIILIIPKAGKATKKITATTIADATAAIISGI